MLKISHIKAHLPQKNCQLTFLLRSRSKSSLQQKPSQLPLTNDYIDIDIDCAIELGQFLHYKQDVELCAIAILQKNQKDIQGESKVCVGVAFINVRNDVDQDMVRLGGVKDQDGYIVYSVVREQQKLLSARSLEQPQKPGQKSPADKQSRGFIKYKNSSSSSSQNDKHQQSFDSRSGSQSPFRKNKFPQQMQMKSEQFTKLLDQLYHEILEQQLFNQRIINRLQQNQIFQLRYKSRIQAILSTNTKV